MDRLLSIHTGYRWSLTLSFAALIIVLSITPDEARPDDSIFAWLVFNTATVIQKLMHVLLYAILTLLAIWSARRHSDQKQRTILLPLVVIGLGALLEWSQTMIPGRYGSLTDILFNGLGVVTGTIAARHLLRPSAMASFKKA